MLEQVGWLWAHHRVTADKEDVLNLKGVLPWNSSERSWLNKISLSLRSGFVTVQAHNWPQGAYAKAPKFSSSPSSIPFSLFYSLSSCEISNCRNPGLNSAFHPIGLWSWSQCLHHFPCPPASDIEWRMDCFEFLLLVINWTSKSSR